MPAESWGTGESTGIGRKWHIATIVLGVAIIVLSLAVGRPAGSIAGLVLSIGGTLRLLSVRGRGIDPSKSTMQRVRNRESRKYGRPF
jgi:hypothetical protein